LAIGGYTALVSAAIPLLKLVNKAKELPEDSLLRRDMYMAVNMRDPEFEKQLKEKRMRHEVMQLRKQYEGEVQFIHPASDGVLNETYASIDEKKGR